MKRRRNSLEEAVNNIRRVANFEPDQEPGESEANAGLDKLLTTYPTLASFDNYVEFLRCYGGAYVACPAFSLGIYGFSGYNVPSFDEGNFVSRDHYFNFADIQYSGDPHAIEFFHFDLRLTLDKVYRRIDKSEDFDLSQDSFVAFLHWIAGLATQFKKHGP